MFLKRKVGQISKEEWREYIMSSENLKTMSEWLNLSNENESYFTGILCVGSIPYGSLNWKQGIIEIDISKTYISEVYNDLINIARKLNSEFYYRNNTLFSKFQHLSPATVKVNRINSYFNIIEFPVAWLCVKSKYIEEVLLWLNTTQISHCKLNDIGKFPDKLCVIGPINELTLVMGKNLLSYLGEFRGSLKKYSEYQIERFKKASKLFGEIQIFIDDEKRNLSLVGRFEDGEVRLFELSFDGDYFERGKRCKDIEGLTPSEIAAIWSINPADLIFFEEFEERQINIYE